MCAFFDRNKQNDTFEDNIIFWEFMFRDVGFIGRILCLSIRK